MSKKGTAVVVDSKEKEMKQIKRFFLATLAAGLLCLGLMLGTSASAADENPCSEDIAKFCQNIRPGTPALMDCLEKNENELSEACKAYEAKMGGPRMERREQAREIAKFRQACTNDIVRFCKETDPGQGGIIRCLNEHGKEISPSCSESMKALKE